MKNACMRPWTGRVRGVDIPWGHHEIRFDGAVVQLDERAFNRFDTWESSYGDGDSTGVRIDDLLEMLPRILYELRHEGWTIVPPGGHLPGLQVPDESE